MCNFTKIQEGLVPVVWSDMAVFQSFLPLVTFI